MSSEVAEAKGGWEHFPHGADIGVRGVGPTRRPAGGLGGVSLGEKRRTSCHWAEPRHSTGTVNRLASSAMSAGERAVPSSPVA